MQITKAKKEHAEVILSGTLLSGEIEKFYSDAVKAAMKEVALPGFRKGHVPEDRIIEEVGKNFLWKNAAERALKDQLEDIIKKEEVVPITPISISLKTPEYKADVAFEISVITPPTATLEDYKQVAKKAQDMVPKQEKEKEVEDAKRVFRAQVRAMHNSSKQGEGKTAIAPASANERKAEDATLLTDEEAKLVGLENAKAAEHFIEGEAEKAVADRNVQRKRSAAAEALLSAATYNIPKVLITDEAKALLETFKKEVKAQGMEWNDYLKRVNKTENQVKDDLAPNAEKRIALDLIFAHIIREEKFELSEEDKKKEEEFAHKIAEQGVDHDRAHAYAREQFLREKVWEALGVK